MKPIYFLIGGGIIAGLYFLRPKSQTATVEPEDTEITEETIINAPVTYKGSKALIKIGGATFAVSAMGLYILKAYNTDPNIDLMKAITDKADELINNTPSEETKKYLRDERDKFLDRLGRSTDRTIRKLNRKSDKFFGFVGKSIGFIKPGEVTRLHKTPKVRVEKVSNWAAMKVTADEMIANVKSKFSTKKKYNNEEAKTRIREMVVNSLPDIDQVSSFNSLGQYYSMLKIRSIQLESQANISPFEDEIAKVYNRMSGDESTDILSQKFALRLTGILDSKGTDLNIDRGYDSELISDYVDFLYNEYTNRKFI